MQGQPYRGERTARARVPPDDPDWEATMPDRPEDSSAAPAPPVTEAAPGPVRRRRRLAGADRRADPADQPRDLEHHRRRERGEPDPWDWDGVHALPAASTAATSTASPPGRSSTPVRRGLPGRAVGRRPPDARGPVRHGHLEVGYTTTNLPLEDLTGGKAWLVWEFDGKPLTVEHGGGPAAGAAPVLLEVGEVGHQARRPPAGPAGLLGAQRLPRPRRPVAPAALPGR